MFSTVRFVFSVNITQCDKMRGNGAAVTPLGMGCNETEI